ncbi:hypothetical protein [Sporosarcina globispora]|uniref:hypothetical protein n=1 Tax=Sporosarcina globispora TaxID=1459 RepID=UPI000A980082|nr:hypothetical protein [Sporosarcina globispora]
MEKMKKNQVNNAQKNESVCPNYMMKVLVNKENVGFLLFRILILLADLHPPVEKA